MELKKIINDTVTRFVATKETKEEAYDNFMEDKVSDTYYHQTQFNYTEAKDELIAMMEEIKQSLTNMEKDCATLQRIERVEEAIDGIINDIDLDRV